MPQVVAAAVWVAQVISNVAVAAAEAVGASEAASVAFASAVVGTAKFLFTTWAVGELSKPPKLKSSGTQLEFRADITAGIPIVFGRTAVGGNVVLQYPAGPKNKHLNQIVVLGGAGPYEAIESFRANQTAVAFDSVGHVTDSSNPYYSRMWQTQQLGACPSPVLPQPAQPATDSPLTAWTTAHKLSGYCAAWLDLEYDTTVYSSGQPVPQWTIKGVKGYDPRLDSTYPGGSGSCRVNDQTTWIWSENPFVLGLTWALGWQQNGKRVAGCGIPVESIDLAGFVEGANVADLNGWKAGGAVRTTDSKWQVLKSLLKAGGGEPIQTAAKLSCMVSTPRTSLATVGVDDLAGGLSLGAMRSRRDRINAIVPTYRSEANNWAQVAARAVTSADYQTFDGGLRQQPVTYDMVQDAAQVAQIAAYDVVNSREFGPLQLQLRPKWMGYKPGDCITVNVPEAGLNNQKALVTSRAGPDVKTGIVTLTLQSETDAKHAFALGQTANPPPTPGLTLPDFATVPQPAAGQWSATGGALTGGGASVPCVTVAGDCSDYAFCAAIVVEYRISGTTDWSMYGTSPAGTTSITVAGLAGSTDYDIAVSYTSIYGITGPRRVVGPGTTGGGYGVAAAIVGQGALATLNAVTWATQVTGTGKPDDFANKSIVYRQMAAPGSASVNDIWVKLDGSGNPLSVYAWDGSAWILGADITAINTAAAITGQGALATLSSANWSTQVAGTGKPQDDATNSNVYRSNSAPSSPLANDIWVRLDGSGNTLAVYSWDGSNWINSADLTALNTAAAIAGQGVLATQNSVDGSTIDNSAVATHHLAADAVTGYEFNYLTNVVANTASETTIISGTLATTGGRVVISGVICVSTLNSGDHIYRIYEDGVKIAEIGYLQATNQNRWNPIHYLAMPGAGTHTYDIRLLNHTGDSNLTLPFVSLQLTEYKR